MQQHSRFEHIDAMRAVAVLFVVWMHLAEGLVGIAGSQRWLSTIAELVNFGRIGVVIFFAISGMLIPSSLRNEPGAIRRFVFRRFFRLFPAFWLSVIIYWTILPGDRDMGQLVANLTMLPWVLGHEPLLGLYWTLETELYFYLACVVIFWSGRLHDEKTISIVSSTLAIGFVVTSAIKIFPAGTHGAYTGLLLHLSIMFWGASFRSAWGKGVYTSGSFITSTLCVVAASAAIVAYGIKVGDTKQITNGAAYLIGMGVFAAMATFARVTFSPLVFVGRISYSIYLLHGATLTAMAAALVGTAQVGNALGGYMLVTAALAIGVSWLSYVMVERPGMEVGSRRSGLRRRIEATEGG